MLLNNGSGYDGVAGDVELHGVKGRNTVQNLQP